MKKNSNIINTFFKVLIAILVTFLVTVIWLYGSGRLILGKKSNSNDLSAVQTDTTTAKINLVKSLIKSQAINDFDEELANEYMIKGYVASLNDIYSEYYTKDEMKVVAEDTLGSFVGIGVYMYLSDDNSSVMVYDTIKNSPAAEAGIQPGDIIKKVDGEEFTGDNYSYISDKIKGKEGSNVKITILRNDEEIEYDITRRTVEISSIKSQMLENNIGYIQIESFDGNASKQFKEEYEKLVNDGMQSLIIDVRSNGGGIVPEATKIADMFLDKGTIILKEKTKNNNETITTAKTDKEITMNTVILINGKTASSSEIFSGSLKVDADNVKLIGTKTYGKGVIQTMWQFADGTGLKLTTEEYCLSNNEEIKDKGVTPDITVEYNGYVKGVVDVEKDEQLKRAIEELK